MLQRTRNIFSEVVNFFPIQLLINNFKKNQILLLFWFLLFAVVTENFGNHLGIPYLFLDPEYMHDVTFKSMLIMGVSFAIFTISFFITSYILDSHKFAFLGTIKYPFVHFCINNSVFPILFMCIYLPKYFNFQSQYGFESSWEIFQEASGFVIGFIGTVLIVFLYFSRTNKDLYKLLASKVDTKLKEKKINAVSVMKKLKEAKKKRYRITSYLSFKFTLRKVDQDTEFDRAALVKIIDQHHLNAVTVELVVFVSIITIGLFKDNPTFQLPAAASAMLLFSFFVMFTGAFSYWLRGWAITGIIVLFVLFNQLVKTEIIESNYEAFGINYNTEKAEYSLERVESFNTVKQYEQDHAETVKILENWKAKFDTTSKPKMVFVCASGGGQRAAVWTTHAFQHTDSCLGGNLMDHTMLMTGASGGLIGACYYRQLVISEQYSEIANRYDKRYVDNMSKDLLNPMIFSMVVSDFFLRFQKFELDGQEYYKGRGYAFESQLRQNTDDLFLHKVMDYKELEQKAEIPMVIMAPTVINDGRRLYISPQNVSYMCNTSPAKRSNLNPRHKGIEFMRFFEKQNAANLEFTSALRMSATFPYVTPNVQLPSNPEMEIMDAGLSDNFGIGDAMRFLYTFREWIKENTSGVVVLMIRDSEKNPEVKRKAGRSIWTKMVNPIGSLYSNWDFIQDFTNDNMLDYTSEWFDGKLDLINLAYVPSPAEYNTKGLTEVTDEKERARASLSWHLTKKEKVSIISNIQSPENTKSIQTLRELIGEN